MGTESSLQPSELSVDARLREEIAQHLSTQSWMMAINSHGQIVEYRAEDHLKVATAYLGLMRVQKAFLALRASLRLADSGAAHALMATLHADESDSANQALALNHALRAVRRPDCPEPGFLQALTSLKLRGQREALSFIIARRGCRRFPESSTLQRALADGHYHRGEFEQAYRILDKTLEADAPSEAIERAYRCAMNAGDWLGALKQGKRLAPACAWLLLGDAYAQAGEIQEAVASYQQGLEGERWVDHFLAHLSCALALASQESAKSLQHLLQAGKLLPHLPSKITLELSPGVILRVDRMAQLRELVASHLPGGANSPLPSSLGSGASILARLAAYAASDPRAARDWRLRAAERHLPIEHAPQAMRDYLSDSRYREAWEAFWLAAWRGPRERGPHDLDGWDSTWPLDPTHIRELYREVLGTVASAATLEKDLDPTLLELWDLSSRALWFGGMFSELVALSRGILRHTPESLRTWRYLAQAQQELGNAQEAQASYAQLLVLLPGDPQATSSHAQLCETLKAYGHEVHPAPTVGVELEGQPTSQARDARADNCSSVHAGCDEAAPHEPLMNEHSKPAEPLPSDVHAEFSASGKLPLRTRLYLVALLEHGCSPDGEAIGNIVCNGARNLSPTRSYDRQIVLTLKQQGWIAPDADMPLTTPGGRQRPLEEIEWQLNGKVCEAMGDQTLSHLRGTLIDFEEAEAALLWNEIAVEECIEYLIRECGRNHWDFEGDKRTRNVFSRLLARESLGQVHAHIYFACHNSAAEELRHGVSPQEGMRQIVSRIYQRSERGLGTPFRERYYLNKLSTLSRLFYDRVLGIDAADSYSLCVGDGRVVATRRTSTVVAARCLL